MAIHIYSCAKFRNDFVSDHLTQEFPVPDRKKKMGELPISIPFVKNQCLNFYTTNYLIYDICILHTMFILCTILRGKKSFTMV